MFEIDGDMFGGLFDLNRDGKLDASEFVLMQKVVFGDLDNSIDEPYERDEEISEFEDSDIDFDDEE